VLWRALSAAREAYQRGERNAAALRAAMNDTLGRENPTAPEYVSVANPITLEELETIGPEGALVSTAVRFGAVRLIDNVVLEPR
jgi:pantoate--beta-alanine ligase